MEKFEILTIPILFLFSWIFLFHLSTILDFNRQMPDLIYFFSFGLIIGIISMIGSNYFRKITDFKILEINIRSSSIIGAFSLIGIILLTNIIFKELMLTIKLLFLIFSTLSSFISFCCLILSYRTFIRKKK